MLNVSGQQQRGFDVNHTDKQGNDRQDRENDRQRQGYMPFSNKDPSSSS